MKRLGVYLKPYTLQSILGPLFKLLEALLELFVPLVVADIIDTGIAGGDGCGIARDKIDFLEHICNFSGWEYDEHKHWQSCSCGKTQNEGEHTGDGDTCTVCDAALSEALGSGSIDGGLSWSLSRSGALTISGSGKMPDFSSVANAAPWDEQKDKIQSAVIESGVQSISGGAFSGCTALTERAVRNLRHAGGNLDALQRRTVLKNGSSELRQRRGQADGLQAVRAVKRIVRQRRHALRNRNARQRLAAVENLRFCLCP